MAEPRLSLCVNTRDEEANIARCLRSARDIVHEMIVVDTGSTDHTVEIARSLGATVFFHAWQDDFADARNAALDRAHGDWTLWLDADEWLLPESAATVRLRIRDAGAQAYYVQRQEIERDGQTDGFVEMRQLRLWRQDPALRFQGRDHPHMNAALDARAERTGEQTRDSDIRIRHDGFRAPLLPGKRRRAIQLLQKELAERPGQIYYETELGRAWVRERDPRGPALLDSVVTRVLSAGSDTPPPPITAPVLESLLRADDPHGPRVTAILFLTERWFPGNILMLDAAASACFRRAEFARAIAFLEKLVRITTETHDYDRTIAFPSRYLDPTPYLLNLGACHHQLGHRDAAIHWYRRTLARSPEHADATRWLALLETSTRPSST